LPAHHAVPLLSRARRALIVGDPQQLEPVVVLEPELLHPVMRVAGADVRWSPEQASVQHLADASSRLGTDITIGGTSTWVGLPLRAHFRCANPMFELSNTISYGGQMIQLRSPDARPLSTLDGMSTTWIDIPLAPGDRHWGPEDRRTLYALVSEFAEPPTDELFVIMPFRQAAAGARADIAGLDPTGEQRWTDWAKEHVGTIHTFQGREADTVILMLSAAAERGRAREWAARTPNLLNVAVTRARERLVVVGHFDTWSQLSNFDLLAERLRSRRVNGVR
jgi:superfamily I DNA and/or RNA helicase